MSKRQKVMQALLNSNVDLDSQDLIWINRNLPNDDDGNQNEIEKTYVFNHTAENLFDCIGVTEEAALKTAEIFAKATKNVLMTPNFLLSNAVEDILNEAKTVQNFEALIVSKLLRDSLDKFSDEKQLPEILSKLIADALKRKGGKED